ncbi:MAG: zinc ribbon domain-containing protein [Candidatus Hodarchaeales archaeon]
MARRCTFGVSLFLDVAWEQNVSARSDLERFRHGVEEKSNLSSGFAQTCRDRASALVKAWLDKRDDWQRKIDKLEKDIKKLEDRKIKLEQQINDLTPRAVKMRAKKETTFVNTLAKLAPKYERLARRLDNPPRFPMIKRRQPIWFDYRIGTFAEAKTAKGFKYWISVSTLRRGKKLELPVQVYPHVERLLRDTSWHRKSFSIVWNSRKKQYAVHLKLEKEVTYERLSDAWGVDLGMKRLAYAINEGAASSIVLDGNDPEIRPLLSKLKELENRIARLQRLDKTRVLKKFKNKRYLVAEQLRNVIATKLVRCLPAAPVLVSIGQPRRIREKKGARQRNTTTGKTSPKKHRKRIHRWSYKAQGDRLYHECLEHGHFPVLENEHWTTRQCHFCGSRQVIINDREIYCPLCWYIGDRDANGGLNIKDIGKKRFVKLQHGKKSGQLLKNVVCDFPLPSLGKWKEKTGGRPSRKPSRNADVNRPRTRDEPALQAGEARKIPVS